MKEKWLVTSCHAVTGSIIKADSPEEAAQIAFGRKTLSGMKGGIKPEFENFVTVYRIGPSYEFYPIIEYELTGVREKP